MSEPKEPKECSTCAGTGLFAKKNCGSPEIFCDGCRGTGLWKVAECIRLMLETDRLIGESNPKLAGEIQEALEELISAAV